MLFRLISFLLFLNFFSLSFTLSEETKKTNVVLIMADDFGFECLSVNGGSSYATPRLDRLASEGIRFTNCHVQPLCTPTRVQFMTGKYNIRNYTEFGILHPSQKTFGNYFRDAGHATCVVGKWQLGSEKGLPGHFGFDESYLWQQNRRPPRYANPGLEFNGDQIDFTDGEYGPDIFEQKAIDFIVRNKNKPFFLYYPMVLTHDPFQPAPDHEDWNPKQRGEKTPDDTKYFASMVVHADKIVGRILDCLEEQGLRNNTLVVFLGDNGTSSRVVSVLNGKEYRGGKRKTTRAGTHVPLIVSCPGMIDSGEVVSHLIDSTDFLPTLCDWAGITLPKEEDFDGIGFYPYLKGNRETAVRKVAYCWHSPYGGSKPARQFAHDVRYKLYGNGNFYDTLEDPLEEKPLDFATLNSTEKRHHQYLRNELEKFKDARPAWTYQHQVRKNETP